MGFLLEASKLAQACEIALWSVQLRAVFCVLKPLSDHFR